MKRQNKLRTYLTVTAGAGCVASVADAAVTFYGVNGANDTNSVPPAMGVEFRYNGLTDVGYIGDLSTFFGSDYTNVFTRGGDLNPASGNVNPRYFYYGFDNGAVAGDSNYVNVSFDGDDDIYEAVAQFYLDGMGGGYLISIATTNAVSDPQDLSGVGGPALSISAGKAMIDAAAVPEPSSLALLALGSAGLAARRRRKQAA